MMSIWRLSPIDLSDPSWEASSHRGAAIVRAPDEKTARKAAQSAFGVQTRFRRHSWLIPPWTRTELVQADHIEDPRYDPDGPNGVLVPSFDADLATRPKRSPPVVRGGAARGEMPSSQQTLRGKAELKLLTKVRAALRSEPSLGPSFHPSELEFECDGMLVLGGEVDSIKAKKLALERVAALPGIATIVDRLHVKPATHMSDKEIRAHVRDMLVEEASFKNLEIREIQDSGYALMRGAPAVNSGHIDFEVKGGVVTLDGSVPGLTSKRLAGVMAWWVPGVRDVVNGMAVEPSEDDGPDMIAEAIRVVLETDPFVDAGQVRVGVRNTVVRLTGLVPSETEREAAERDAWCAFGVDNVINDIDIRP